jgi:rare lipoprotein A
MRPSLNLRRRRLLVAAGAATITIPATAVALTAGRADALSAGTAAPGSASFQIHAPVQQADVARLASDVTSDSRPVGVTASLQVPTQSLNVLGGQTVYLRGRMLPAAAGRKVWLQGRTSGSWKWLATARTGPHGGFQLRYVTGAVGQQELRVRFPGDARNRAVSKPAGQLTVYQQSVASWYEDAGGTACGFHANFGVASRDLPCGTQVTFRYNGRTVTAVVDDRGPFVAGRDWDLNQNTAAALGFSGVDTVWSSI